MFLRRVSNPVLRCLGRRDAARKQRAYLRRKQQQDWPPGEGGFPVYLPGIDSRTAHGNTHQIQIAGEPT